MIQEVYSYYPTSAGTHTETLTNKHTLIIYSVFLMEVIGSTGVPPPAHRLWEGFLFSLIKTLIALDDFITCLLRSVMT